MNQHSDQQTLPLILEPEDLETLLADADLRSEVLLVAVCDPRVFNARHIPGSVLIEPAELLCGIKPATGKIPDAEQLSALFSRIGLRENQHVIAYDDEGGGWAGRLIWTLDVIGHRRSSYLNGGLIAWLKGGHPLSETATAPQPSQYQVQIDRQQIASLEEISAQLDNPQTVIWDARAEQEFTGEKVTALRNGHIPGAVNLDWLHLMDRENDLRLQPLAELRQRLLGLGMDDSKQIITHCQTHHRSGLSYLVGKALGLNIRAYDGSWAEWGNHPDTAITTGEDP